MENGEDACHNLNERRLASRWMARRDGRWYNAISVFLGEKLDQKQKGSARQGRAGREDNVSSNTVSGSMFCMHARGLDVAIL